MASKRICDGSGAVQLALIHVRLTKLGKAEQERTNPSGQHLDLFAIQLDPYMSACLVCPNFVNGGYSVDLTAGQQPPLQHDSLILINGEQNMDETIR